MAIVSTGLFLVILSDHQSSMVPAVSTWTQTSDRNFKNGTLHNLTLIGSGSSAGLEIDLSEFHDWTNMNTTGGPDYKYYHTMTPIYGTDKVLLFGGQGNPGTKYYDETWIYDLSDNTWTIKYPKNGIRPGKGNGRGLAPVFGDDKVVLFGGHDITLPAPYYSDETWIYDLSDNTWTKEASTNKPSARWHHAMTAIPGTKKILVYGGYNDTASPSYYDDTWIYDVSANSWTKIFTSKSPGGRWQTEISAIYGTKKILLFGSYSDQIKNDTWIFDFSTKSWNEVYPKTNPKGRYGFAMAGIFGTDQVLLFGGSNQNGFIDDTWVYDLSDNTWTQKIPRIPTDKPQKRWCHAMAGVFGTDQVVMYGGLGEYSQNPPHKKDTWVYEHFLPTKNGTFISEPFDTGSKSDFLSISWYSNIPENSSIKFQIRTGSTELDLNSKEFIGPGGLNNTHYTISPSKIWPSLNGDRWVQYKAYLNISIFTHSPTLKDVTLIYNCLPVTTPIDPVNESILVNNKPTFKWTFEDFDSPHQTAFQLLIDDNILFENATYDSGVILTIEQNWEFPLGTNYSEIADGNWYWKLRTMDSDGGWTEYSTPWRFTMDTLPPSSITSMPENNGFYNRLDVISGVASDHLNGSGINKVELSINRLTDGYYWDGSGWTPFPAWVLTSGNTQWIYDSRKVTWTSGVRYNIRCRATDNATNIENQISENIFTFDKDSPTSSIDIPEDDSWLNELNSISGNSVDNGGSGIAKIFINIQRTSDNYFWDGNDWNSTESWLKTNGISPWTFDTSNVPWVTGTQYIIRSQAKDHANNLESPALGNSFSYDAQPPKLISIVINNGDEFTNSTAVILSLQAEDCDSGLDQMSFSTNGIEMSAWEPFASERFFTLPPMDGDKVVYFRARDSVGNIAESISNTIFFDSTPPHQLSMIINENSKYTNSSSVRLNLAAMDSGSGLNKMSFSTDMITWTAWQPFESERTFALHFTDGEQTIYFRVSDNVGNIAEPISSSIILDTLPPHSLSLHINNGAFETNSTIVTLQLHAQDDTSGINQMSFSTDGETWTAWEPYDYERSFPLPPDNGVKTVYFKVKDYAGNIANPAFSKIMLRITSTVKEEDTIEKSSDNYDFWYLLLGLVISILAIIIVGLIVVLKRKKPVQQELLLPAGVTIKPGTLPSQPVSVDKITPSSAQPQLPGVTTTAIEAAAGTTPRPRLAKSTLTAPKASPHDSTVAKPQQLPQLPPAQQEPQPNLQHSNTEKND